MTLLHVKLVSLAAVAIAQNRLISQKEFIFNDFHAGYINVSGMLQQLKLKKSHKIRIPPAQSIAKLLIAAKL